MSTTSNATQSLPSRTNSGWTYWPYKRSVIATSIAFVLLITVPIGGIVIGAFYTFVALLLITPAPNNRNYFYQLPGEIRRNRRLRRDDGVYRNRRLEEVLFETDDEKQKRIYMEPVQANFVPLDGGNKGHLTEIHTKDNGRHTLFTLADGMGEAVANDPEQIAITSEMFISVLKQVVNESPGTLYASTFFCRVPADPTDAYDYYVKRRVESDDPAMERLQKNYETALNQQVLTSGDFRCGIGISLPRPKSWGKYQLGQLPDSEIIKAPGYRVSDLLNRQLASIGVENVRRPSPFEAVVLLRTALDFANAGEIYADWHEDRRRDQEGKISFEDSLLVQAGPLPDTSEWRAGTSYLRVGDTYTRMFFVTGFPNREVPAGFMQHLFNSPYDIWYQISVVYETISQTNEQRRLKLKKTEQDSKNITKAQRGASRSVEQEFEEQITREEEAQLFFSRGEAVKMNVLASVSSDSLAGLKESEILLKQMFREVGLAIQVVRPISLQVPTRLAMFGIRTDRL